MKEEKKLLMETKRNVPNYWGIKPGLLKPRRRLYQPNFRLIKQQTQFTSTVNVNTKIRDPVKYLVENQNVPRKYAIEFLVQPSFIEEYWKEDSNGLYIDKSMLDSIGYGWKKERKEFVSTLKSTEKVRTLAKKQMKKEYGKDLTHEEMEEKLRGTLKEHIAEIPVQQQMNLRKIQKVMNYIRQSH